VATPQGIAPPYFNVISASQARRFGPVILEAARRQAAIGDGLSDGRHASIESCTPMTGPLEQRRDPHPWKII
jgi:hypothetical protein